MAVIVILAIIAVIATPIITGIIEDSKKSSFERSAEGVVEATKFDITDKLTDKGYTYNIVDGTIEGLNENVKISNSKGINGTISYNKEGEVSYAIHNDKWCVVKKNNEVTTSDYTGECVLEVSTVAEAFTYMDNIESFEVGDNCVSYFKDKFNYTDEDATKYCNKEEVEGYTLKGDIESDELDIEELKTNNVIKNVVTSGAITIIDYDINKGGVDIVIPSTIDGKTAVAIGEFAFEGKTLSNETSILDKNNIQFMSNKEDNEIADSISGDIRSVVIPSTVKSIGYGAFRSNQLTSVTIESADTNICCNAFAYNYNLTSIKIAGVDTLIDEIPYVACK